jgi:hypothetical protein
MIGPKPLSVGSSTISRRISAALIVGKVAYLISDGQPCSANTYHEPG